jgi:hypothetical protein
MAASVRTVILNAIVAGIGATAEDDSYPAVIQTVSSVPVIEPTRDQSPAVYVHDGRELDIEVRDATHRRYVWTLELEVLTKNAAADNIQSGLSDVIDTLTQWVDSGPDLGDNVLDVRLTGQSGEAVYDPTQNVGMVTVPLLVRYWEAL